LQPSSRPTLLRWAFALFLLATITRLPAVLFPHAIDDESIYTVVATEIVEGGRPYVDAVERKPPLLFWTYAAVFGLFGKYNWLSLHLVALLWTVGTMVGLYAITRRLFDRPAGLIAALLYCVYAQWLIWKNLAFNGELLMNLPIVLGALIAMRPSPSRLRPELLLAGAFFCCGFLLKQPAAIAAVPFGVYLLLPSYRRSRGLRGTDSVLQAALLTAGFAATLGIVVGILLSQGIFEEALFWTIGHHDIPHGLTDPVFWKRGIGMSAAFFGVCLPLVLATVSSLRRRELWDGRRPEFIALVILLGASLLGTSASGRFYPHYFIQLVPPMAVLAAPVFAGLWTGTISFRIPLFSSRFTQGWLALTTVVFLVGHSIGLNAAGKGREAGNYIRAHSSDEDRIFVWGQAPDIYLDAERRPASRYIATFPLTGYIFGSPLGWDPTHDTTHRIVPGTWEILDRELRENPPLFIVDTDGSREVAKYPMRRFDSLRDLIDHRYDFVHRARDGLIYRRRDGC